MTPPTYLGNQMYIAINRERMVLLHKHSDINVLADLVWLESIDDYTIDPIDTVKWLRGYTDLELKLLYRNISGNDHSVTRSQLLQIIDDIVARVTPTPVNKGELERQCDYVQRCTDTEARWLYVHGASRPAQKSELFNPACRRAADVPLELNSAKSGKLPALTRKPEPFVAPTASDRAAVTTNAQASGPKRGTAKAVIWEVADKMWEDAGSPTDKAKVLVLRKQIMKTLENEEAIKNASSSSELGQWHKKRAPF